MNHQDGLVQGILGMPENSLSIGGRWLQGPSSNVLNTTGPPFEVRFETHQL